MLIFSANSSGVIKDDGPYLGVIFLDKNSHSGYLNDSHMGKVKNKFVREKSHKGSFVPKRAIDPCWCQEKKIDKVQNVKVEHQWNVTRVHVTVGTIIQ